MTTAAPWPQGFRIVERTTSVSDDWLERFRGIPTSWVSDSMGRVIGSIGLTTYHGDIGITMVGRALTVRVRPGDNLMIHKALHLAQRNDVILIDGGGDLTQSLIGGNMRATAIYNGVAGFVVDGAIRDLTDWATGEMPVWARGHTHRGPSKDGPGEINVPIVCAGMVVHAGDLVIGDADGVLVIPTAELEGTWPAVERQRDKEAKSAADNPLGKADPGRIDALLRAKGCPV